MTGHDSDPDPDSMVDQLPQEDTLDDRGVEDALDEGYTAPERWSAAMRRGPEHVDTLDERLAEERPDQTAGDADRAGEVLDDGEVGDERSGRLTAPDRGLGPDEEPDMIAEDVGVDGAAASAEEAAMHTVDEAEIDEGRTP